MKYAILALAAFSLTACVHDRFAKPIHFGQIEPFTYLYRPLAEVRAAYGPGGDKIRCFWDPISREMWVSWGNIDCWPHEAAHASGLNEDDTRKLVGP